MGMGVFKKEHLIRLYVRGSLKNFDMQSIRISSEVFKDFKKMKANQALKEY